MIVNKLKILAQLGLLRVGPDIRTKALFLKYILCTLCILQIHGRTDGRTYCIVKKNLLLIVFATAIHGYQLIANAGYPAKKVLLQPYD